MKKKGNLRGNSSKKTDVYEDLTQRFIAGLEKGLIPWKVPYGNCVPQNMSTKHQYSGINYLFLSLAMMEGNFSSGYFLTFLQARKLGGHVKKGSEGFPILCYKENDIKINIENVKKESDLKTWTNDERKKGYKEINRPFVKRYFVFNIDQIEIDEDKIPSVSGNLNVNPIEVAEKIVEGYSDRPQIKNKVGVPAYYYTDDIIEIPQMKDFISVEEYYCCLFHELVHSASHPSRSSRESIFANYSNIKKDSFEELVAEIGASMLCQQAGILAQVFENSQAYINDWIAVLQNDNKMIAKAASEAQKRVDYIIRESICNENISQGAA